MLGKIYEMQVVKHAFAGIGVAVCAVLIQAVVKLGKAGLVDKVTWAICIVSFVLAFLFDAPTIIIIVLAGISGIVCKRISRKTAKEKEEKQI